MQLRQATRIAATACLAILNIFDAGCAHYAEASPIQYERAQSLAFEPNRGQTDDQVRFLARGNGYTVFLTSTEAVFAPRARTGTGATESESVRMRIVGANPSPTVSASNELDGKVNYVLGADATAQLTGIPTYGTVRYTAVYPHIDLVYHDNAGRLEYDFVVDPEGNPDVISLRFDGASSIEIDDSGMLMLRTAVGELRHGPPLIYQERDDGRDRIEGHWIRTGPQTVGVRVASYDRARPLVIDPVIAYSTYLGGNSNDWVMDIALDAAGNVYVTGGTTSPNFPGATPVALTDNAAFVTKLTASGRIIYSTYLLETDERGATGIAVDTLGNAYVTGGTSLWRATGWFDVFVAKLDAFGRVARPGRLFLHVRRAAGRLRQPRGGRRCRQRLCDGRDLQLELPDDARRFQAHLGRGQRRFRDEGECLGNRLRLLHTARRPWSRLGERYRYRHQRQCVRYGQHRIERLSGHGCRVPTDASRLLHGGLLQQDGVRHQSQSMGHCAGLLDLPRRHGTGRGNRDGRHRDRCGGQCVRDRIDRRGELSDHCRRHPADGRREIVLLHVVHGRCRHQAQRVRLGARILDVPVR
jgi:hypothetical protein